MPFVKRLSIAAISLGMIAVGISRSQNPPAPTVDRVGFPTDYQHWNLLYVFDRPDNKSVRTVYGNAAAAATTPNDIFAYPYGSIVVMETWGALLDSSGNPLLDGDGRFQKDSAKTPTIFVMRKERGFGADYGANRNGEWEYVAYHPDGTYQTTPQNSFSCAICHLQATQAKDWVFRYGLHINRASGVVPGGTIQNYTFTPSVMSASPAGGTITIYNDDVIAHQIADDAKGGWVSDVIPAGGSVTIQFRDPQPFEFTFHCNIHPSMRGKIVVR